MDNNSEKVPTIFIELCDQRSSGFIKDGTAGTPFQEELRAPSLYFIPNVGFRRAVKKETDRNGKEREVRYNEKIRYIANEVEISYDVQEKLGILPAPRHTEDKIVVKNGQAMIAEEGTTVGLYRYIMDSYFNESNPERSEKATAIYRIVELDKKQADVNDNEFKEAEAKLYIRDLVTREGNEYHYDELKIDGICSVLNIHADMYSTKVSMILDYAKARPGQFLDMVKSWEGATEAEVVLALDLGVIKFEGNVAMHADGTKIITKIEGSKGMKTEKLVAKLADFLRTKQGHEAYMELQAKVEVAQKEKLK